MVGSATLPERNQLQLAAAVARTVHDLPAPAQALLTDLETRNLRPPTRIAS